MDNSHASSYCACGIANLKEATDLCRAEPVSAVFNIRRTEGCADRNFILAFLPDIYFKNHLKEPCPDPGHVERALINHTITTQHSAKYPKSDELC